MHVDDVARARGLVQRVDVLRDDHHLAGMPGLQPRQRLMRRIGPGLRGLRAAGVVEPVHEAGIAREAFGRRHILDPVLRPEATLVAERAQPAFRRNPGTGQYDDLLHRALLIRRLPRKAIS
jgi:hypothetical protein